MDVGFSYDLAVESGLVLKNALFVIRVCYCGQPEVIVPSDGEPTRVSHHCHLNARDTTLAYASRASQPDIERLKARMDWKMPCTPSPTASTPASAWTNGTARTRSSAKATKCSAPTSSTTAATKQGVRCVDAHMALGRNLLPSGFRAKAMYPSWPRCTPNRLKQKLLTVRSRSEGSNHFANQGACRFHHMPIWEYVELVVCFCLH
jgi:predicted dithiol-disulfide oxidoreductase (DUF899 family)